MISNAFQISCTRAGTTVCVTVAGELDLATSPRLRAHLRAQLADQPEIIVLDLAEVSFIDSTGLHALLDATAQCDGRLRVIPNPALLRLLEITGLYDQLTIVGDDGDPRPANGPMAERAR